MDIKEGIKMGGGGGIGYTGIGEVKGDIRRE